MKLCKYLHGNEKHSDLSEDYSLSCCKEKKFVIKKEIKKPGKLVINLLSICIPI